MSLKELFQIVGLVSVDGVQKTKSDLNDVTDTAQKSSGSMESSFKKIGAAIATYLTVDTIVNFGKSVVDAAASVSAEASAFEQIMGDYTDQAKAKMQEVADATGVVDTRLTGYMTSMTAKFKGLGYDVDEATTMAQEGLMLASDAAAFWDKSLEDSMGALNSFINGNYEGGEAIGLFANDTQMAAYAVEQGIVSETKAWANLDEATKQATRLEYAQNMFEMSGAVGQAAKESDQYANVQANLNEKWRQFQAQIGEPLLQNVVLPAMQALMDIVDDLSKSFEDLSTWIAENGDTINTWVGIIAGAGVAVGTFLTIMNWGSIMSAAATALNVVKTAVLGVNAAMAANSIGLVISLIAGLVAAFVYLWNTSEDFRNFWIGLWDTVKKFFMDTWNAIVEFVTVTIPEAFNSLIEWFQNLPTMISEMLTSLWESIVTWWENLISSITEWFDNLVVSFQTWFDQIIQSVVTWGQNLWTSAVEGVTTFINNVVQFFNDLPYKIGYALGQVIGAIIKFGMDAYTWVTTELPIIIQDIINWFAQLPVKIGEFLSNILNNVIEWGANMWTQATTTATNFFNSIVQWFQQLPGKVLGFITTVLNNVKTWGTNMVNQAKTTATNFFNGIVQWFQQLPGKIAEFLSNIISKVIEWGSNLVQKGKQAVKDFVDNIVNTIKDLPGKFVEMGKNVVNGFVDGVKSMISSAVSAVGNFFGGIVDGAKNMLGIHSPSKVFRDIGINIGEGLNEGIEDETASVVDRVATMAKEAVETANEGFSRLKTPTLAEDIDINRNIVTEPFEIDPINVQPTYPSPEKMQILNDAINNSQIVARLESVIDLLSQIIPNQQMQVVLDTGTLVGEMTPLIDTQMGDIARRKER